MEYNGGTVVAMVGKDCVAIASDKRFGQQGLTIADQFPKIFEMQDRLYLGLAGFATDVLTLASKFKYKINMHQLQENKIMSAKKFSQLTSSVFYETRYLKQI